MPRRQPQPSASAIERGLSFAVRIPLALLPEASRPIDVLTVGLNSMDLLAVVEPYPPRNSKQRLRTFAQLPGGQAASAAVGLARLGWRTEYIGRFGSDGFGQAGADSLEREGVKVTRVVRVPDATSHFSIILVDRETGERTVLWDRHPDIALTAEDISDEAVASARVVLVDCHETAAVTSVASRARRAGARTVLDVERVRPGIDALLREIDVIIAAEHFPVDLTGKRELGAALDTLQRETGAAIVCVTLGERGSLARCNGMEVHMPAFLVDVVDTTGAGDVFRAGFIAAWLEHGEAAELETVLRYANAVAALKCRELGARTGAPTREEVHAFLRNPQMSQRRISADGADTSIHR
jgi:sulfofructose kinase